MNLENYMQYIWFGIALIFIIAEIITPTFSFFVWFAGGAIISGIAAYSGIMPPMAQIIIFLGISIILIIATKPLQKKLSKANDNSLDNRERLIGKRVQVIEEINNVKEAGKVFLEGSFWSARSYKDDEVYAKDEIVTVIDIDGILLIVKK